MYEIQSERRRIFSMMHNKNDPNYLPPLPKLLQKNLPQKSAESPARLATLERGRPAENTAVAGISQDTAAIESKTENSALTQTQAEQPVSKSRIRELLALSGFTPKQIERAVSNG